MPTLLLESHPVPGNAQVVVLDEGRFEPPTITAAALVAAQLAQLHRTPVYILDRLSPSGQRACLGVVEP